MYETERILRLKDAVDLLPMDEQEARAWLHREHLISVISGHDVVVWSDVIQAAREARDTPPDAWTSRVIDVAESLAQPFTIAQVCSVAALGNDQPATRRVSRILQGAGFVSRAYRSDTSSKTQRGWFRSK